MSVHNVCLVQELRLADARFHTTPCGPKLERSVYRLSIFSFFLVVFVVKKNKKVLKNF